jgi:chitinase
MRHFFLVLALFGVLHGAAHARPWISAYCLAAGPLSADQVDYTAFSHLIHFGIFVNADGTVNPKSGITQAQSEAVIGRAHAAGCKVLVCLGTDQNGVRLRRALQEDMRPALVRNLVAFVQARGYDGLDLDMEPLEDADVSTYEPFVRELRAALGPNLLLTAAVAAQPAMFARLQDAFDQINLMTYDLSGPWPGFRSWYNAGLYGSGTDAMADGSPYPSVDGMVHEFTGAGVAPAKLGIGIAFYGYVWTGVDGPRQDQPEGLKVDDSVDYNVIMDKWYQPDRYHWDSVAQAPWLGIDSPQKTFVSYDDETLVDRKLRYVREQGLGGAIIWELSGGWRSREKQKDALLQAVKRAWLQDP